MASFEGLIIEQRETFKQFRRILPNYRKLGKERFTLSKTNTRIDGLKELWSKCRALDVKIKQATTEAQRQHKYFGDSEFLNAEADFEDHLDQLLEIADYLGKQD
ncbi:hypothetical protein CAJAP_10699 [Camponotus japonicus]